mmetsp:Transcript_7339/g.30390  ORF Transcript_7339/g.30390 Transcript_7339/m.30390 type:complete len:321 (+) Transcript_7339:1149-2111(+)
MESRRPTTWNTAGLPLGAAAGRRRRAAAAAGGVPSRRGPPARRRRGRPSRRRASRVVGVVRGVGDLLRLDRLHGGLEGRVVVEFFERGLEDERVEAVLLEDDADFLLDLGLARLLQVGRRDARAARLDGVEVLGEGVLRGDDGGHVLVEDGAHLVDRQVRREVEVDRAADVDVELAQLVRRLDDARVARTGPRRRFRLVVLDRLLERVLGDAKLGEDAGLELAELLLEVLDEVLREHLLRHLGPLGVDAPHDLRQVRVHQPAQLAENLHDDLGWHLGQVLDVVIARLVLGLPPAQHARQRVDARDRRAADDGGRRREPHR